MRRLVLGAALCATLTGGGAAEASHEERPGGPRDFAVGAGRNEFETGGPNQLMVSAHGFGAEVTGHVRGTGDLQPLGAFRVEGEVTCLRVEGNRASIKYRFKSAMGPGAPPEGSGVQVFVEDNGEPVRGQPVDLNGTNAPEPPGVFDLAAHVCDDPRLRPLNEFNPIDEGNYTVHDAS